MRLEVSQHVHQMFFNAQTLGGSGRRQKKWSMLSERIW